MTPMPANDASLSDGAETGRRGGYRWAVMGLIFLVYTAAYADRANIGIALPYLKGEFDLTNTQAGLLASIFAFTYSACQVPFSFAIGRFGVRYCLPIFMILTSLVTFGIGVASSLTAIVILRALLGVVEAPVAVSAMTSVNNWFPRREKGTAASLLFAATKFAPLIVPPLGALIILSFGWRWLFILLAIPGIILGILWFFLVADDPRKSRFVSRREAAYITEEEEASSPSDTDRKDASASGHFPLLDRFIRAQPHALRLSWRDVLTSRNIWFIAVGFFFIQGIVGFFLAWLPTYLSEVKKFAILDVGFVSAAPFAGAVIGNIAGGVMSDRLLGGRRKPAMLVTAASTIVMMYALTAAPGDALMLSAQLFVTGFLLSVGISGFTIYPARMTDTKSFPLALAMVNTGGQLGTAFFPLLTGILLDQFSWDAVFHGLAIGSGLAFLVILLAIEPMGAPRNSAEQN